MVRLGKLTKGVKNVLSNRRNNLCNMYQIDYIVKSQDESFSNAQKKKEALELLNEKPNTNYYVCALPVKMQKTG